MLSHWMSWRCGASFSALILNWWGNYFQGGEQAFKVISELLSSRVSAKELPPEEELKRVMTSSMIEKFQEYKKLQSRGHKDFYSKVDKLLHIELLRCSVLPFFLRSFLSSHPEALQQPDSKFTWVDLLYTMSLEKLDPDDRITPVRDAVWRFRYSSDVREKVFSLYLSI